MRILHVLLLSCLPATLWAQDRQGNDTPGDWRVDVFEQQGVWSAICDWRDEDGAPHRRCYIRYVDVFSPRPDFAAQFLFVTPQADGPRVDFGIEAGTIFAVDGFRIERAGATVWQTRHPGCLTGLTCRFRGADGAALLDEMRTGGTFRFTFTDRHGTARDLGWPLEGFDAAWRRFAAESGARGLM